MRTGFLALFAEASGIVAGAGVPAGAAAGAATRTGGTGPEGEGDASFTFISRLLTHSINTMNAENFHHSLSLITKSTYALTAENNNLKWN
jgi:hypothetical protein